MSAAVSGGFTLDDFVIDTIANTVTCPNGLVRPITTKRNVTFGAACRTCPLVALCTTSAAGRKLKLNHHEDLMRAVRRQAETEAFQQVYTQHRPMVERGIAWITRGNRKVRYCGVNKNNLWLHTRVAAVNLRRLLTLGLTRQNGNWALTT